MAQRWKIGLPLLLTMTSPLAVAVEITPFAGFRAGADFEIHDDNRNSQSDLEFDDAAGVGFLVNVDLDQPGKQAELYYSTYLTTASTADNFLSGGRDAVDIRVHQLQFGGLYFPGGKTVGGFVSGVVGLTLFDPEGAGFERDYRPSIALGAGYKVPLNHWLAVRFDLRGIYTALDSGEGVFCSGGCRARFESNGFLQVEADVGLSLRF